MKKVALFLLLLVTALGVYSQQDQPYQQPKLVVGIVVDQMRYDYLTRFWNDFGDGGFKRLINEGFLSKKIIIIITSLRLPLQDIHQFTLEQPLQYMVYLVIIGMINLLNSVFIALMIPIILILELRVQEEKLRQGY